MWADRAEAGAKRVLAGNRWVAATVVLGALIDVLAVEGTDGVETRRARLADEFHAIDVWDLVDALALGNSRARISAIGAFININAATIDSRVASVAIRAWAAFLGAWVGNRWETIARHERVARNGGLAVGLGALININAAKRISAIASVAAIEAAVRAVAATILVDALGEPVATSVGRCLFFAFIDVLADFDVGAIEDERVDLELADGEPLVVQLNANDPTLGVIGAIKGDLVDGHVVRTGVLGVNVLAIHIDAEALGAPSAAVETVDEDDAANLGGSI